MSGVWLRPASLGDVLAVARAMRAWDRREIFACRWDDDAEAFARGLFALCDTQGAVWAAGRAGPAGRDSAVAIVGGVEQWPGCWSALAFATDEFEDIAFGLTRRVRREIIPWMVRAGARRVECRSHAGHLKAHRWLAALGARCEARHAEAGRDGADFLTFAWRREDVCRTVEAAE